MSSLPKILFLVTQSDLGGAQRYVLALAKASRESFTPIVAAGPDGGGLLFEECQKAGVAFHLLPSLRRTLRPIQDLRAVSQIRTLIRSTGAELVHSNSSKAGVLVAAAFIGIRPRSKLIYTVHGWSFLEPLPGAIRAFYRFAEKLAGNKRDATIVLSEKEKTIAVTQKLARAGTVHTIPIGIAPIMHDRERGRDALVAAGVPRDALVIGCVANFYASKNIPGLVDAFEHIAGDHPNAHLVLVGDGEERSLIEQASQRTTKRIHLLGYKNDAGTLLDGFDLFVLPSVKEGLPFALLEAMEAGLPCLATDVGGIPKVIADGVNGWITEPKNLEHKLAIALERRAQWESIGTRATETVRSRFTDAVMTEKTFALYRKLTSRSGG